MFSERFIFWILVSAAFSFFIYRVGDVVTPFIAAFIISYLLNPIVLKLERFLKLPRGPAALITGLSFFSIIFFLVRKIIPLIFGQLKNLANHLPEIQNYIKMKLLPKISAFLPLDADQVIEKGISYLGKSFLSSYTTLFESSISAIHLLIFVVLIPILTLYMLKDWDLIKKSSASLVPRKYKSILVEQAGIIDQRISGYIRGQTNVSLIMACFYSIIFSLYGLNYGLLIGVIVGISLFVPYVGFASSSLTTILIAFWQFGDIKDVIVIASIFGIGHVIESYILAPRLIGSQIGLHPLWILFAVLAGASLFGFVGILFAFPVTAIVSVLLKFLFKLYFDSSYYNK